MLTMSQIVTVASLVHARMRGVDIKLVSSAPHPLKHHALSLRSAPVGTLHERSCFLLSPTGTGKSIMAAIGEIAALCKYFHAYDMVMKIDGRWMQLVQVNGGYYRLDIDRKVRCRFVNGAAPHLRICN
ncbi:hypothetical protein T492DRAFT_1069611 [Pavlovales sp. CCMP2436]|nr:hypothetical protein T492DRAFT_1069611 [Pavlovales sp. CCMP2436]